MNRQFAEQLLAAGRIKDRRREYTIEEDGKEVTFTLVPMEAAEVAEYIQKAKEDAGNTGKHFAAACDVVVKHVKEFADMSQAELEAIGELSKWDMVNKFISYNNQVLIARAVMEFSGQAKREQMDGFGALTELLVN